MSEPVFLLGPVIGSETALEDLEDTQEFVRQAVTFMDADERPEDLHLRGFSESSVFTIAELRVIFPSFRD